MNILYQFNNRYAPYGGVSITSLFENNKNADEIVVHILDDNTDPISLENRDKLYSLEQRYNRKIIIYNTDILVEKIKSLNIPTYRGSYAANMRMFFDEILDLHAGKLLYLDADTIIEGDLEGLFQVDLDNYAIGMILESQGNIVKKSIGLAKSYGYYNSGVILYDIDKWIQNNCRQKIIDHAMNVRSQYVSPDQDLINLALRDQIKQLDLRYNFQPFHGAYTLKQYAHVYKVVPYYSYNEIEEAEKNVVIYHCYRFLNEFPWNQDNYHPFNDVFDKYLNISPWNNYVKDFANHGLVTKIEKVLYKILPKLLFLVIFKMVRNLAVIKEERDLLKNG